MLNLLVALSLTLPIRPAEAPFQDLTLDQALAAAKKDGKVVMIDFFTTWCQPCKRLDKVTWKDAGVQTWLGEKTVALKLDAEKEVELAKRFGVESYPTITFIKPDGTKIDAIIGFKEPAEFLELSKAVLSGKPVIEVAKERLAGKENDPMYRSRYGAELARAGKLDEALAEYLWCFDHGAEQDDSYSAVRRSFLLSSIAQLGTKLPAATKALEDRRTSAEDLLLSGKGTWDQVADVSALNQYLSTPKRMLELFDKMREQKLLDARLRWGFLQLMGEMLIEEKRYQDFLEDSTDPLAEADAKISTAKSAMKVMDSMKHEGMENESGRFRDRCVTDVSRTVEALLGTKQTDKAQPVADRLIEFAPSGTTYATLIGRAVHADDPAFARALAERGRKELPEEEKKTLERAAKKIPAR